MDALDPNLLEPSHPIDKRMLAPIGEAFNRSADSKSAREMGHEALSVNRDSRSVAGEALSVIG